MGVAAAMPAPIPQTPIVYEDEPAWNCYVHGNGSCGDVVRVERGEREGSILSAANDGRVYVSWEDGTVTHATMGQRRAAWDYCVWQAWQTEDVDDGTLEACDVSYMEPGDWFEYDDSTH